MGFCTLDAKQFLISETTTEFSSVEIVRIKLFGSFNSNFWSFFKNLRISVVTNDHYSQWSCSWSFFYVDYITRNLMLNIYNYHNKFHLTVGMYQHKCFREKRKKENLIWFNFFEILIFGLTPEIYVTFLAKSLFSFNEILPKCDITLTMNILFQQHILLVDGASDFWYIANVLTS